MANNKRTRIKIKKSKINLYNKKKSKSRQALTLVITIFAVCVFGVVGYGIGKPIMNYLESQKNPPVESPGDSSSEQSSEISSEVSSEPESSNDTPPEQQIPDKDINLYILPPEAVTSSASLNSALAVARESGYDTVAVTLKDEEGFLYYSSDIESVKDTNLIHGTLSAAQICDYITKAGMTPAAKISTLKDPNTSIFFGSYRTSAGVTWLDNDPNNGGRRWLSPFLDETVEYIGALTSELSQAGFRHIILVNTKFPPFHNLDADVYLTQLPIKQREPRLDALWNVADAAKAGADEGKARLWLEFSGSALLASEKFATDAELTARADKLEGFGIIAEYTMENAEKAYDNALDFAKKLKAASGENDVAVLIKNGPSGAALADIQRALEETELSAFHEN